MAIVRGGRYHTTRRVHLTHEEEGRYRMVFCGLAVYWTHCTIDSALVTCRQCIDLSSSQPPPEERSPETSA